jgi:hypothetical protein
VDGQQPPPDGGGEPIRLEPRFVEVVPVCAEPADGGDHLVHLHLARRREEELSRKQGEVVSECG